MAAGIPNDVPCTTINKVFQWHEVHHVAAQAIASGDIQVAVAEHGSMSRVPHYFDAQSGTKFGDVKMKDGMLLDGLTDVYNATHMGNCAELCAKEHNISREAQDDFAIESYTRSAKAWSEGAFADEVVPVAVPQRKGDPIHVDTDQNSAKSKWRRSASCARPSRKMDRNGGQRFYIERRSERFGPRIGRSCPTAGYPLLASPQQLCSPRPEWFTTAPRRPSPVHWIRLAGSPMTWTVGIE